MSDQTRWGDFTALAESYARYRAGYAEPVLDALLGLHRQPVAELTMADVGAGTGIFTRQLAARGPRRVTAVEPNAEMRARGERGSEGIANLEWRAGSAEETGLPAEEFDWVSMASSFHWPDFERATREFHRLLRPGGRFVALWNPRRIENNPLLVEIEDYLHSLAPELKTNRVSSGRSSFTAGLAERLAASPCFCDVIFIEGQHVERQSPERYLGLWRSVNDVRVQLGESRFQSFLGYVEERVAGLQEIEATYWTRAWSARRA